MISPSSSWSEARFVASRMRARTSSGTSSSCLRRTSIMRSRTLLRFLLPPQPFERLHVGDVGVVVVAVGFDGPLRERRGLFETAGREIRPAEDVPGSLAIGLALDGALRRHARFRRTSSARRRCGRARPALPAGRAPAPSPGRRLPVPARSISGSVREPRRSSRTCTRSRRAPARNSDRAGWPARTSAGA